MLDLNGTFLASEIFRVGKTTVTIGSLITVLIVILVTIAISRALRKIAERALDKGGAEAKVTGSLASLIHYVVLVVGFGVAIGTLGIDLTALFAAGAIFAIGLGFAMQSIAQNFVAGVLLLVERSIKPGDIIEAEGRVMMVREMGIRASLVRSRDGEDLIIPNASLIQNTVKNFTMRTGRYRIRAAVRVHYSSDMELVKNTLTEVGRRISSDWGHQEPPQVLFSRLGETAAEWEVGVWIDNPWERLPALSQLNEAIWFALQKAGIRVAYPQIDVHLPSESPSLFAQKLR